MATPTSSSREARRRRIVERGSDRFALITGGRIQTPLPSSPAAATCPPSDPSSPFDFCQSGDKESATLLSNHDFGSEIGQRNTAVGPSTPKYETSVEASKVPAFDLDCQDQSSQVSSTFQNPRPSALEAEHHFEPRTRLYKFCTPSQISLAVSASESSRIHCAVAAAVLVVLAYIGAPTWGNNIVKSVIFFRPLYLLLLTNISIVASELLEVRHRGSQRTEQQANSTPSTGGYGLANQLGDALEIGLVLQKVVGALFMDCSIYSVVVICGLSLAKRLGW